MKKNIFITISGGLIILLVFLLIKYDRNCINESFYSAKGDVLQKNQVCKVDSKFAKQIIEKPNSSKVINFYNNYANLPLNTNTLSKISKQHSVDVASLYFLKKIETIKDNKKTQALFNKRSQQFIADSIVKKIKQYHIVFVPGLAYKDDPNTGANLQKEQFLLDSLNVSNELVLTNEWGSPEENALIIAERIKKLQNKNIILFSASKGSLDTSVALGKLLQPKEYKHLKGWITACGILNGSPIADNHLKFPKSFFVNRALEKKGTSIAVMEEMSYSKRIQLFKELKFSTQLPVIHYVGIPWATQINKRIKKRFCAMKTIGPNDGLTPITDQLTPYGKTVIEMGMDHFFEFKDHTTFVHKHLALLSLIAN